MSTNSIGDKCEIGELAPKPLTKQAIRRKVWSYLEKNNLVNFPRPVFGRIPNFKGCEEAAAKLSDLNIFKYAHNIYVNPDKPQEPVRYAVLEFYKNLFVPVPQLSEGFLKHITLPETALKDDIRRMISRKGIEEFGQEIGQKNEIKINLIVLGSVAVSLEGHRIGKGKGYADLEYAILNNIKAINANTIIVTTVHDVQVFDTLPENLFKSHDVPVDIIITPTRVIEVRKRLPKPQGIIWGLVSPWKLDFMPIMKTLREQDELAGRDVALKRVDSDLENNSTNTDQRSSNRNRRSRYLKGGDDSNKTDKNEEEDTAIPRRRVIRNKFKKEEETGDAKPNLTVTQEDVSFPFKSQNRRTLKKSRPLIDFTLVIRNIEKNVRVRDLKAALSERGIKPNTITWRGVKGYCCLHFSKTNPSAILDPETNTFGADNILDLLRNLTIHPDSRKELKVEIMKPISHIKSLDVTSV